MEKKYNYCCGIDQMINREPINFAMSSFMLKTLIIDEFLIDFISKFFVFISVACNGPSLAFNPTWTNSIIIIISRREYISDISCVLSRSLSPFPVCVSYATSICKMSDHGQLHISKCVCVCVSEAIVSKNSSH